MKGKVSLSYFCCWVQS